MYKELSYNSLGEILITRQWPNLQRAITQIIILMVKIAKGAGNHQLHFINTFKTADRVFMLNA